MRLRVECTLFVITKLGANPRRIGDRLVWVVRSNDLTHWATRAPSIIGILSLIKAGIILLKQTICFCVLHQVWSNTNCWVNVRIMVFSTIFNNISVISWRSVLLVEETWVPGENYRHWQTLSHNVWSTIRGFRTHNVSGYMHWLHR